MEEDNNITHVNDKWRQICLFLIFGAADFDLQCWKKQYTLTRNILGHLKREQTCWLKLWNGNEDDTFQYVMRISKPMFQQLFNKFETYFINTRTKQQVAHCMVTTEIALVLCILYLTTTSEMKQLCFFFFTHTIPNLQLSLEGTPHFQEDIA